MKHRDMLKKWLLLPLLLMKLKDLQKKLLLKLIV